jgi:limonene-1,2-epoxide hydrolase
MTVQTDPRQATLDVINRFCHALDARDWDMLSSALAEDVVLKNRMVTKGVPGPATSETRGRDAALAMIQGLWTVLSATYHMNSNHVITVAADGKSATGTCALRAYHAGTGAKAHLFEESLARIDFETVKQGSDWTLRLWDEAIYIMLGTPEVFSDR